MRRKHDIHHWRNLALFALFAILLTLLAGAVWLARWRAMVLVHPGRSYPARTPADFDVTNWEDVRFASADGLALSGWFIPPGPAGDGATLIFVHGLGSNREDLLAQAALLSQHGYGALLLDLRNHGESQGTVATLGYNEVEDIRGAMAFLLTRQEVDVTRVGLIGHSMGGATSIMAASRIKQIRVVIAQSAYSSVQGNMKEGIRAIAGLPPFPFAPLMTWFGERETGVSIRQVSPIDDVARIAPRAILLIHGEQDPVIQMTNSLRLYEAAKEPKELYLIPSAGHGEFLDVDRTGFEERVLGFLRKHLH